MQLTLKRGATNFQRDLPKLVHWKLAKLNSNEAKRAAAARARSSSSVLRPIANLHAQDDELSSSGTINVVSSVRADANGAVLSKEMRNNEPRLPLLHQAMVARTSTGQRDPQYEQFQQSRSCSPGRHT
ncbi:hypothetical protein Rs2_38263 [Raphanus sativus]|nr:hypothetical protein Rs2_38263 [Raphanus sativus]